MKEPGALNARAMPLWLGLLLAVSLLGGCASSGAVDSAGSDRWLWVPGEYRLEARISYRQDRSDREAQESRRIAAEAVFADDALTSLKTDVGVCLAPEASLTLQGQRRNARRVSCGDAVFELWFDQERLQGSVTVLVRELVRERGGCSSYRVNSSGQRVCVAWFYSLRDRPTQRRSGIRSTRIEG